MGGSPRTPKIPVQKPIEEIQKVEEDATMQAEQQRKKISNMSGRAKTMLAGIGNALQLKNKLG